ncbi:DUF4138 domain-containing protein [Tunicatimonas pelagia]|uniref:DUF4138 domain-containing protein n=1 Tax=Tunicatimonas pelagia TaxID=931531 RepID=UPI0026666B1D|nr:DUF4138 domain-containing protein [Tunicatimonas pelagia]WKN44255.1 DUF4138 domain-containing protein [Tunicatimonas pelagia]
MKLICLLFATIISLFLVTQRSAAQQTESTVDTAQPGLTQDTIYVSHRAKSYLLFDEPVTLVDVGNPTQYQVQIEGNSILVVATCDSVAGTPFYAVVGGDAFTAQLQFHSHPEAFYDFRNRSHRPGNSYQNQGLEKQVLSRLQELSSYQDLNYASTQENGIRLRLVGIMHDLSATYLKFKVENRTSLVYQTDFIGLERLKRYRKGFFSKEQQARFPMEPIAQWQVEKVLPYSEHYFYQALPLQALERQEALIATLREKNGTRSISLKIPARLLRKADLY